MKPGTIPETMLVAVHDEPALRFLPAEMNGITKTMGTLSPASEGLMTRNPLVESCRLICQFFCRAFSEIVQPHGTPDIRC